MGGLLKVGILLPTRAVLLGDGEAPAQLILDLAERADAIGCQSVWVGDSLTTKPRLDPLVTLGAVAARTRRVQLGTAVLLGAFYQPVLLARATASLDVLSGGRLVLAMGVGNGFTPAQRREWTAAGVEASHRRGRLEELVELLPRLWSGEPVTYHGRHFDLDEVKVEPVPVQRPSVPIWLACHGQTGNEAQYRRAARLADGIISITDTPDEHAAVWRRVRDYAVEYGRDPDRIERAFYLTVNVDPDAARGRAEGVAFVEQYYGRDVWGDRWGPYGSPDAVAERVLAYAAAGAQHVIIRFAAFDQPRQMDVFERLVLPALTRFQGAPAV